MIKAIKAGKNIVPYGVRPEPHEYETTDVFLTLGKDVEFLRPSRRKGSKTADVRIDGTEWEIKSPDGSSRWTIENQLKKACKQSPNIIFDGRRTKLSDERILGELRKLAKIKRSVKRLVFIDKNKNIIVIK